MGWMRERLGVRWRGDKGLGCPIPSSGERIRILGTGRPEAEPEHRADNERTEFLRWSCERLMALLQAEVDRRGRTRTHAQAALLLVPAVLALVLKVGVSGEGAQAPQPPWWIATTKVMALAAGAWSTWCWFRVMRVEGDTRKYRLPALKPEVFLYLEGTTWETDYASRLLGIRLRLVEAVRRSRRVGSVLARDRGRSLAATMWTLALAGILLLLEVFR